MRNEFHLNPLSSADVFVPCGGRPESIDLNNVSKLFHENGSVITFGLIISLDSSILLKELIYSLLKMPESTLKSMGFQSLKMPVLIRVE